MKLYYSKGACSLAVHILIRELNLPCEFESVNLKTKQTETDKNYLTINPKGAVPALMLDDGQVLTENAVIHQYLADMHHATQLLPPVGDFSRYRVLEWLNFISTDLHKGFGPLFNPKVPAEIKDEIFKPIIINKLKLVDKHLEKNQFLMGNQFTLPDGYLFVMLSWLFNFNMDISTLTYLSRYNQEVKNRKSVQEALREEGLS